MGNLIRPTARRLPDNLGATRIQEGLQFFPPLEIDLKPYEESDVVYSNRLKVQLAEDLTYLCPAPLSEGQVAELNWLAAAVVRVTGSQDVSRVDFRLDARNNWKPYILEINPLPGLSPGISDIVIEAAAAGISHPELVLLILHAAMKRYGML